MLVYIYRHAFRHILVFFTPPCLYLGEEHVSWSTCSSKWHVFAILFFFVYCPEPHMGISGVGSFPVWSGGSLIIFQLFRCRNFALNRFFPTFLSGRHVFIFGGTSGCPLCLYAPRGADTPTYVPILLYASVCSQRLLHVVGGCRGPLHVGHLPLYGGYLPICLTPPLIGWIPCATVCLREYLHVIWGIFPLC